MPSKAAIKKAEDEYKKALEEAEAMEDDPSEAEDDIIILRGNARAEFMEFLEKSGYTLDEAAEEAEEVEEEVAEESTGEEVPEEESGTEKPSEKKPRKAAVKTAPRKKIAEKEVVEEEEDPKPKSRHRFFG